jgi:predicted Rdx family selenoprotein
VGCQAVVCSQQRKQQGGFPGIGAANQQHIHVVHVNKRLQNENRPFHVRVLLVPVAELTQT